MYEIEALRKPFFLLLLLSDFDSNFAANNILQLAQHSGGQWFDDLGVLNFLYDFLKFVCVDGLDSHFPNLPFNTIRLVVKR
jgi:hypothetical protein